MTEKKRPSTSRSICSACICTGRPMQTQIDCQSQTNLVPRILWLFGQRVGARRDSGVLLKLSLRGKRFRGVFCTKKPIFVFLDAREMGRDKNTKEGGGERGEEAFPSPPSPPLFRFILLSSQFQPIKQRRTPRKRLLSRLLKTVLWAQGALFYRGNKIQ